MDYQVKPIDVAGCASATGVYTDRYGAWLGEWNSQTDAVDLYTDNGEGIPAPADWREMIIADE